MFQFKPLDLILAIAIICITLLETVALLHGINGNIFLTSITLIAGLAGFRIGHWRSNKSESKDGPNQ